MSEEFFDETDWLKPIGFKPGRAVVFHDPSAFTVGDLLDSLCKSTVAHPRAVSIPVNINAFAPVVIDTARRLWVEDETAEAPAGEVVYHNDPDWYMEGQLHQSTARVRLYVITCDGSHIEDLRVQYIVDEAAVDGIIRVVPIN